ncbi:ral guanine nucleotide dissociation stimulator-like isoform X2 [Diceros bicornis minor]|nr:ral guanine nucleotide dissociation stimulator-like isoform X2 [Diceros bicornis minor]
MDSPTPLDPHCVCVWEMELGKVGMKRTHLGQEQEARWWESDSVSCSYSISWLQERKVSAGDQAPLSACESQALEVSPHSFPGGVYADAPLCLIYGGVSPCGKVQAGPYTSWPECWALSLQSCTQEMVEELVDGFQFAISMERTQVHQSINEEGWSECEDESTLNLNEACRMRALQAGMMEKLTQSMALAFVSRNISSFTTFMVNYSASDISHRVLDQLFTRSCPPSSIPSDALIASFTAGDIFPYSSQEGRAQDHLKM